MELPDWLDKNRIGPNWVENTVYLVCGNVEDLAQTMQLIISSNSPHTPIVETTGEFYHEFEKFYGIIIYDDSLDINKVSIKNGKVVNLS